VRFHGVIPAVMTPFDREDRVDRTALAAQVAFLMSGGVHGLVALGTMGEYGSLDDPERDVVIETVLEAADGQVPVTVGVSSPSARLGATRARRAEELGASSIMSLPPTSYAADEEELRAFFAEIAAASRLPILLYNNPSGSKNDLLPETVLRLSEVAGVSGVKETSGDARRFAALRSALPDDVEVVVGIDDLALEGFAAGASGWVTGCGVVAPRLSVDLFSALETGDLDRARAIYLRLLPLARLDASPKLVQYFKAGLDLVGQRGGPSRPPRRALTAREGAVVQSAVAGLATLSEVSA
jgi:dihydrodipicolinate synthase/N-acetylneuraminate lyase